VEPNGDYLYVRFTNNGPPIDEKTVYDVNNDRYEELDTKWGLVIAKSFAQHDDGDLKIENQPDGGTTLIFALPVSKEEELYES
jgi:K+-sensing histidine kinase KdpD